MFRFGPARPELAKPCLVEALFALADQIEARFKQAARSSQAKRLAAKISRACSLANNRAAQQRWPHAFARRQSFDLCPDRHVRRCLA